MRTKLIKIFSFISLLISLIICINIISNKNSELKTYKTNQSILTSDIIKYKTKDSLNVSSIKTLTLSLSNYKDYNKNLLEDIKKLNLRIKNISSIVDIKTETINKLNLLLKDSSRIDTITNQIDTLKCFSYKDDYLLLNGCLSKDSIQINCSNKESLVLVKHFTNKRFLGIRLPIRFFGYRHLSNDILSKNPNTIIHDFSVVNIKD